MDSRWRIVNDEQREELTTAGTFRPVREITFELIGSGRTGKIVVDLRNYQPDYVQTAVSEAARAIAAVSTLEGD